MEVRKTPFLSHQIVRCIYLSFEEPRQGDGVLGHMACLFIINFFGFDVGTWNSTKSIYMVFFFLFLNFMFNVTAAVLRHRRAQRLGQEQLLQLFLERSRKQRSVWGTILLL